MTKSKRLLAITVSLFALTACAPQTRFVWGNYEPALYAYYKNPSERLVYEKALTDAIDAGRKSGKVAPGLCAELGYMQLDDGNLVAAKASFEEEMRLFPESRPFLTGVITRMSPSSNERKEPTS